MLCFLNKMYLFKLKTVFHPKLQSHNILGDQNYLSENYLFLVFYS